VRNLRGVKRQKGGRTTTPLLSAECQKADCDVFMTGETVSFAFFHKATFGLHFRLHFVFCTTFYVYRCIQYA